MKKANALKVIAMLVMLVFTGVMFTGCSNQGTSTGIGMSPDNPAVISIDQWIGYKSLLDANGGLTTTPDSINAKHGIYVNYVIIDDHVASSQALISGNLHGAGYSVNRYSFLLDTFTKAGIDVTMPFITNFSNGGDGIITTPDITAVEDLVGKKIGVMEHSEGHLIVEYLITNSGLSKAEQENIRSGIVKLADPQAVALALFAGEIDAAATWEPFLTLHEDSTSMRVLFDTSMSTNLILSGVVFRNDFAKNNSKFMMEYIDAAIEAAPMYKTDFSYIRQMPAFEQETDEGVISMANGAALTNWTQNYKLLTENAILMFKESGKIWNSMGLTVDISKADTAFDTQYLLMLRDKYEGKETVTSTVIFNESDKAALIEAPDATLISYKADIKFSQDSFQIRDESYAALDEFVKVAKILDGVYIQIEGNTSQRAPGATDDVIKTLSMNRANAVANYFIQAGIPAERLIIIGNGDSNLLDAENPTSDVNKRTEFSFKTQRGY